MTLSLDDIEFLCSNHGRAILQAYSAADVSGDNTLPLLTELRKSLPPRQAAAVVTTLKLRQKARTKFPDDANKMLFTEDSLQQASHPLISQYRSGLLEAESVLDVCCGIGTDTMAFAKNRKRALGLDIDSIRIAIARHNAGALCASVEFEVADATDILPTGFDAVFYDPGRRDVHGRRIRDVELYEPPLSLIRNWKTKELLVKLSPAVAYAQLSTYGGQTEFISVDGNLAEALLWVSRKPAPPMATLIRSDLMHHMRHDGDEAANISTPKAWLFEPDPAVLRARLVRQAAASLGGSLLDGTIAYVTMDNRVETPWGRYWRILDWMPFSLKKLRRYLVERDVCHVTVKKRGFPMTPEELINRLRLKKGVHSRVLVLTRCQNQPIVIVCAAP